MAEHRTSHPYVFFLVKTQFENIGDGIINNVMIRELSERSVLTVNVSLAPDHFVRTLQIKSHNKEPTKISRSLLKFILSIIWHKLSGKRVIFTLPPGGNAGEKSLKSYLVNRVYNMILALINVAGVEVANIGVSYDELGPRYARMVKERSKTLTHHYVRDQRSVGVLNSIRAKNSGTIPDLAFGLDFDLHRLNRHQIKPNDTFAFSYRTDKSYINKNEIMNIIQRIASLNPHAHFVFISQVERDTEFMRFAHSAVKNNLNVSAEFVETYEDLECTFTVYKSCSKIFSNRLHALLAALSAGVLPIATLSKGHDNKIRGVFEEVGLYRNITNISEAESVDKFLEISGISGESFDLISNQKIKIKEKFDEIIYGEKGTIN